MASLMTIPKRRLELCVLDGQICGAGNYSANILSCEPCAIGDYCTGGNPTGASCGETMTTLAPGAASEDECVCKIGRVCRTGHVLERATPTRLIRHGDVAW